MRNYNRRIINTPAIYSTENTFRIGAFADPHADAEADGDVNHVPDEAQWAYTVQTCDRIRSFYKKMNEVNPDIIVGLGDYYRNYNDPLVDQPSLDLVLSTRSVYTGDADVFYVAGNHDFHLSYDTLVTSFGYDGRTELGGSKFNYVQDYVKGLTKVRVITVDTNRVTTTTWGDQIYGKIIDTTKTWLNNTILASPYNDVIVFAHHGLTDDVWWDTDNYEEIVYLFHAALGVNPNMKIKLIFGHSHFAFDVLVNKKWGDRLIGLRFPAFKDNPVGKAAYIDINPSGMIINNFICPYPYVAE
jgi:predicted phosphodiesterase